MPSWVPDWNNTDHFRLFSGRSAYHATLDRKAGFQVDSKASLLSCQAIIIGEVDGLGASYYESYHSSGPQDALVVQPENINNPYESDAGLCDALWRAPQAVELPGENRRQITMIAYYDARSSQKQRKKSLPS